MKTQHNNLWKMRGSSVDKLTLRPRRKKSGKGLSQIARNSALLLRGDTAIPTCDK